MHDPPRTGVVAPDVRHHPSDGAAEQLRADEDGGRLPDETPPPTGTLPAQGSVDRRLVHDDFFRLVRDEPRSGVAFDAILFSR